MLVVTLLAAALAAGCGGGDGNGPDRDGPLLMYCAAGVRLPVAEIAARYHEETGREVQLQFAGSNTLLGNLEASAQGDLYLAADTSYIELAREKDLADEAIRVAHLTGGLAVPAGNPKGLRGLADLAARDDLRIGLANPDAAAVGKFSKRILAEAGLWDEVAARVTVYKPTVNELANDLKLGTIDVAVIWDAVVAQYPEIDFVRVPEMDAARKDISVGVLRSCERPTEALRFARYLAARDRGLPVFGKHGYEVIEGDAWAHTPALRLYSGAMLRPAIDARVRAFAEREGARIDTVYNGCGILVSQMQAGERPDAYFSCDIVFMEAVSNLFGASTTVTANPMVLLARAGSEERIAGVGDLAKPGLKLGLAHPGTSALGKLSHRLLEEMELLEGIRAAANIAVDSPTGDFLVNQIRAGSLDAAIVYESNARANPSTLEELRLLPIDHPLAVAHQPFAVGANSDHKQLAERLFQAVTGDAERERFEALGFEWNLAPAP